MSLYVGSADANYGLKSSGLIDHNSAYTWMAWVDLVSDSNDYGHIWAAGAGSRGSGDYVSADWVGTGSDGTTLTLGSYVGGSGNDTTASALSVDSPAHITITRTSSSNLDLYVGGAYAVSVGTNVGARGATAWEVIGLLNAQYNAPVRLTAMKQWQAALSADEIKAEMRTVRPLRLANLHSWHPAIANNLTDALKDYSGNGRNWTSQGTNTVETPSSPVSWGAQVIPVGWPVVTAQFARPTSDVSAGTWTASTGSDLFAMLDETAADDGDYITTTSYSTCEVALSSLTDPAVSTGHVVRYRISATGGGIIVRLRQGTTTIASWTHNPAPASLTTYAQTLSGGEADSITSYAALKLQFEATV